MRIRVGKAQVTADHGSGTLVRVHVVDIEMSIHYNMRSLNTISRGYER